MDNQRSVNSSLSKMALFLGKEDSGSHATEPIEGFELQFQGRAENARFLNKMFGEKATSGGRGILASLSTRIMVRFPF